MITIHSLNVCRASVTMETSTKLRITTTAKQTVAMKSPFNLFFKFSCDVSNTECLLVKKIKSLFHLFSFDCSSGVSGGKSDKRLVTSSIESVGGGNWRVLPIGLKSTAYLFLK